LSLYATQNRDFLLAKSLKDIQHTEKLTKQFFISWFWL